nr:immunoglobulin light chain junction region [Macaca mulatta]
DYYCSSYATSSTYII